MCYSLKGPSPTSFLQPRAPPLCTTPAHTVHLGQAPVHPLKNPLVFHRMLAPQTQSCREGKRALGSSPRSCFPPLPSPLSFFFRESQGKCQADFLMIHFKEGGGKAPTAKRPSHARRKDYTTEQKMMEEGGKIRRVPQGEVRLADPNTMEKSMSEPAWGQHAPLSIPWSRH